MRLKEEKIDQRKKLKILDSVTELHLLTFKEKASEEQGKTDLATNLSEMKVVGLVIHSRVCPDNLLRRFSSQFLLLVWDEKDYISCVPIGKNYITGR